MTSAYHPQMDGQIERVNQCMVTFLCCFVHVWPKQWHKWLSLAEFWYNTNYHSSLGHSPCEVFIGPCLQERTLMNEVIKQHLLRHQARMKSQADKNRTEVHFKMGDKVFLKIQTYVSLLCPP
jgi:hypothetical protein